MTDKKRVLFIGNCQSDAIHKMVKFDKDTYDVHKISVHNPNRIAADLEKQLIDSSDIIITQRIRKSYEHLHTQKILNDKRSETKVIIFPSCYMKLYYFDTTYFSHNNKPVNNPIPYHYKSILDCYRSKITPESCLDSFVNNIDFIKTQKLYEIFDNDMHELLIRYNQVKDWGQGLSNINIISIIDLIKDNFNKKLLFYSFNHPTDLVLKYIIDKILDYLEIDAEVRCSDILSSNFCMLYKSLSKILDFNIDEYIPTITHQQMYKIDIIKTYYSHYDDMAI